MTPDDDRPHDDRPHDDRPHDDTALDRVLALGDLDELLREADRRADAGDWDGLERLRHRARAATEQRGHQLWPAASWAEYRTALGAPSSRAGAVVVDGAGYLAPGPLAEVVAQRHPWTELSAAVPPGPLRAVVAAERVVRGETVPDADLVDLPGRLRPWEPAYAVVEYRPDGTRLEEPEEPARGTAVPEGTPRPPEPAAAEGARALVDVLRHWTVHSGATVRAVGVAGSAADALATVGVTGAAGARWAEVGAAGAARLVAWAAAGGGTHGRRRGAAAGRFDAWWVLAVLTGTVEDWPDDPGPTADELRWWRWSAPDAASGWRCRLAVEDPLDGLAWALDAVDPA